MTKPYYKCPRFERCSTNKCLLDPEMKSHKNLPGEEKCGCYKSIRIKLGKDLPWGGLTKSEINGKKRWENLPESKKEAMRARGRELARKNRENRAKNAKTR
jgi:hypothetical protein